MFVSGWNRPDSLPEAEIVLEWETLDEAKAHLLLAIGSFAFEDYLNGLNYSRWEPVKAAVTEATGAPWQTALTDNSLMFWIIDSGELQ